MTLPALDIHLTEDDADAALRADALSGLTSTPKVLRPQWLYDARGSALFEKITQGGLMPDDDLGTTAIRRRIPTLFKIYHLTCQRT